MLDLWGAAEKWLLVIINFGKTKEKTMRKIIDGKLYNTETSEYLGSNQEYFRSDFRYYSEELYRTKKGKYFLAGEGNGLSKYSKKYDDGWGPGEAIILLTEEEAKEWVENHLSVNDYLEIFDEIEEG